MKYGVVVGLVIAGLIALFVMAPDAQGYHGYGYRRPGWVGGPYPTYVGPYSGGYRPIFTISF